MRSYRLVEATEREFQRRKIINAITQGAAIRGSYSFLLSPDTLNALDEGLVDLYVQALQKVFAQFDDPSAVRMLLQALAYAGNDKTKMSQILSPENLEMLDAESREELLKAFPSGRFGYSEIMRVLTAISTIEFRYKDILEQEAVEVFKSQFPIVEEFDIDVKAELGNPGARGATATVEAGWDNEQERYYIDAKATNFAFLLHELVKGLYEIIGLSGWGDDFEDNEEVSQAMDQFGEEPEDQKYGKFLYDRLKGLVVGLTNQSGVNFSDYPQIYEYFLKQLYEYSKEAEYDDKVSNWFVDYINQIVNNKISNSNLQWTKSTVIDIKNAVKERELKKSLPTDYDDSDEEEV